jgi:integrase
MFRQLLIWSVNEGYIDRMPGAGVKVAGVGKTNPAERRNPYSVDQLKVIFGSPLFKGHRSERCRHEPGKMLIRDGKYWVPLIALYSGMRMGEIVQLLVSDIKQDGGVWYFDVNKGEEGEKKLKTSSSKRRVPVHPALVQAGLLDHLVGKKGNARIFSDIQRGKDGYYSHNFSKWWGRYSRHIGFQTKKTAFHSFRHNFKDALQSAEVPEYISRSLLGHADNSVHGQYGSGPSVTTLKQAIDKTFPNLDLL